MELGESERVSLIHTTEDGKIHLLVSLDKEGGWKAAFYGNELAGARHFETVYDANRYLLDAFSRMFPNHKCTADCGLASEISQRQAAARNNFWYL